MKTKWKALIAVAVLTMIKPASMVLSVRVPA